jgi:hypothetical protein
MTILPFVKSEKGADPSTFFARKAIDVIVIGSAANAVDL